MEKRYVKILLLLQTLVSIPTYASFVLSKHCPPSFEKMQDGKCHFRSIYQLYSSPHNKGVGGLRTALPEFRGKYSPQAIDLGRYLFFDPILSKDRTLSCASCHSPHKGWSDGLARSEGRDKKPLSRSAPGLWNLGFQKRFFWDARATSLEEQTLGPLLSNNEMGNTVIELEDRLNGIPQYVELFREAFGQESIRYQDVARALAAFQSSLISLNSAYDRYAHGHHEALNTEQIEGLNIFRSFVARCSECHTPPLFTNQEIAVIGAPEEGQGPFDVGAEKVFDKEKLKGGFKVPSLRNVATTAPYMHSGVFPSLKEAVAFYNGGRGHRVPKGLTLHIHWHIWDPQLTDYEIDRIVDFLHALTDESFLPEVPTRVPSGEAVGKLHFSH